MTVGNSVEVGPYRPSFEDELVHDIVGNQFENLLRSQALDIQEFIPFGGHGRNIWEGFGRSNARIRVGIVKEEVKLREIYARYFNLTTVLGAEYEVRKNKFCLLWRTSIHGLKIEMVEYVCPVKGLLGR